MDDKYFIKIKYVEDGYEEIVDLITIEKIQRLLAERMANVTIVCRDMEIINDNEIIPILELDEKIVNTRTVKELLSLCAGVQL